jgi:hypothetical protein
VFLLLVVLSRVVCVSVVGGVLIVGYDNRP